MEELQADETLGPTVSEAAAACQTGPSRLACWSRHVISTEFHNSRHAQEPERVLEFRTDPPHGANDPEGFPCAPSGESDRRVGTVANDS
jgi:hypothetical protein